MSIQKDLKLSRYPITEVIVIGAGPAGCAAAMLLARHGIGVRLLEQHRFPRDKVCGECLSAMGLDVLARLGALDSVRSLSPAMLTHAALHTACGKSVRLKLPRKMWGVSRSAFDAGLLEFARGTGVIVLQPARCEGVDGGPYPSVKVRDLWDNRVEVMRAGHVLVADGKGAFLRRDGLPPRDFGIKAHFEGIAGPRDTIELFGCRGLYGGLAAIEGGRWNAAFSVPATRLLRHRGKLEALFEAIARENPTLHDRVRHATLVGQWIAAPLPRFGVNGAWPQGVTPIGNAAAAIEPIGGEGMGLALRSAEMAVESLLQSGQELHGRFVSLWRKRRAACRAGAVITSQPALARMLMPMLGDQFVSHSMLRLVGKH